MALRGRRGGVERVGKVRCITFQWLCDNTQTEDRQRGEYQRAGRSWLGGAIVGREELELVEREELELVGRS